MKEKYIRSDYSWLVEVGRHRKGMYAASVLLAIMGVSSGMVPYFAVSRIMIRLIDGGREIACYYAWAGVAALGYLGRILFHNLSSSLSHIATFSAISEIRHQIAAKLTRVPMGYVLDTPSGKTKNTMVEKVDSIEPALAHVLPEMTSNLLVPMMITVYLFILDWRMAFISLITLPIGATCYLKVMKDYKVKFAQYVGVGQHMNATAVEYVNGIEVIKTFGQSAASYEKFADAVKANANYGLDWMKDVQFYFAMGIGIWPAVLVGVLPLGCLFYLNGTLSAPVFITVMILAMGIVTPLMSALYYTDDIAKIGTIMADIGRVLNQPELIRPSKPARLKGTDIKLDQVRFAYGQTDVLHGVSLSIPAGTVTALVGPSGGGKTTIARLIASFWDATGGRVCIGEVDVRDIPPDQLMDTVAYVPQDTYLFDRSVLDNIRMGKPEASDEEVKAAARSAGCHDFIMRLEDGYQTPAGGAGGRLSGGERQRIAIARAMLKDAPIVILDEATAYSDPENEATIQSAIARLVKGKTLIVIAHRPSTVTDSDQIAVVNQGRIEAVGRHPELLRTCDRYRHMWQSHVSVRDGIAGENNDD